MRSIAIVIAALCFYTGVHGFFMASPVQHRMATLTTTGITSTSSLTMTVLSYNGKKKDFKPGTPLSQAVAQLGVNVKYSCKKGDCATCQISLAGRMTRCCIGKVPEAPKLKSLQEKGLEIRV